MTLAFAFAAGCALGAVIGCYAGWAQAHAAVSRRVAVYQAAALRDAAHLIGAEGGGAIMLAGHRQARARLLELADKIDGGRTL